jgi:hypothetical protein
LGRILCLRRLRHVAIIGSSAPMSVEVGYLDVVARVEVGGERVAPA